MYLSKLILNPRNAGARRDLARPYKLHRTLMRGLDHTPDDERLLFRIEPERGPGGPVVLVQSADAESDWSPLLANGYLLSAHGPKSFMPSFREGQQLLFRLVANPMVKKKAEGKKHSVRVPLIHEGPNSKGHSTYWDWLHRQAGRHGFQVLAARDAPFRTAPNRRKQQYYAKDEIPHFGVRFDGLLRVTDPVRLLGAVRGGIGPAKAFGFGLLSLGFGLLSLAPPR